MKRLEIDGLIVRRVLLPAPIQDADPFERQCPDGSLMGLALVALLLVVNLCPEGMPDRLRRPFDKRLPEELGTLEAPVHPGLLAAPFGHRRDPGIFLEFGGGGIAFALFAEGDEQPGGEDGARSWEGLEQGEIGMVLRALRDGGIEIGDGLQGGPELGNEGLHQERIGRDDAFIGSEGCGRFDGLDTLGDDIGIAHVMRTEKVFHMCWTSQRARPNSYRFMKSPITRSCICSVLEKHSVRRTNRLMRVRRLMCLLSIFWVFSLPT